MHAISCMNLITLTKSVMVCKWSVWRYWLQWRRYHVTVYNVLVRRRGVLDDVRVCFPADVGPCHVTSVGFAGRGCVHFG